MSTVNPEHRSLDEMRARQDAGPGDIGQRSLNWPTTLIALVEIRADVRNEVSRTLLETLYRASRNGVVGLALSNVAIATVNRLLDPVVAMLPLNVPGVRYLSTSDHALLACVLDRSQAAFGDTAEFRSAASRAGFPSPIPFSWQFGRSGGPSAEPDAPLVDPYMTPAFERPPPPLRTAFA